MTPAIPSHTGWYWWRWNETHSWEVVWWDNDCRELWTMEMQNYIPLKLSTYGQWGTLPLTPPPQ